MFPRRNVPSLAVDALLSPHSGGSEEVKASAGTVEGCPCGVEGYGLELPVAGIGEEHLEERGLVDGLKPSPAQAVHSIPDGNAPRANPAVPGRGKVPVPVVAQQLVPL